MKLLPRCHNFVSNPLRVRIHINRFTSENPTLSPLILSRTMRAAVGKNYNAQLQITEVPTPTPKDGQILVQVYACGICHSDVHAIDGDWDVKPPLPLLPGHEGCGIVVSVGRNVQNLKLGDRVGVSWLHSTCQTCEYCLSGWETLCPRQKTTGYTVPGCLAEYTIADARQVIKIPDGLTFGQAAPILCAGVTSYKGLKESEVKPGQFVCILGAAGGLGHLAIQYANAMGMRVVAMDVSAQKLEYCLRFGAEFAVDATAPDVVSQVNRITSGGAHGVLCVANSKYVCDIAIKISRRKGTVVLIGLPNKTLECSIVDVIMKRVTIRGSVVGTRNDLTEALDMAARGLVQCDVHVDVLENVNVVLDALRRGEVQGRTVIEFVKE